MELQMQSFKRTLGAKPREWEPLPASSVLRVGAEKAGLGTSWVQQALDCGY